MDTNVDQAEAILKARSGTASSSDPISILDLDTLVLNPEETAILQAGEETLLLPETPTQSLQDSSKRRVLLRWSS